MSGHSGMSAYKSLALAAFIAQLGGCHLAGRLNPDCHTAQEYQHAAQVASLKVPAGLESPNTQAALMIPTVDVAPPPPGPKDACLDLPPRYKAAPSNKAASG